MLERHRALWLVLERTGVLRGVHSVAHFAPEPGIEARLRQLEGTSYRSADIEPGRADEVVDVMDIPWPDGSIDLLICSHVLEHVADDRAALRQLRRVLSPSGFAFLEVPVLLTETDEDPSVVDPQERLRRFGQTDHVRAYGPDIRDRVAEAGFTVEHHDVRELVTEVELVRFGLFVDVPWIAADAPERWDIQLCRAA